MPELSEQALEVKKKRKERYWSNRAAAIAYATQWNKDNPEKRKLAYTEDNRKRYWRDPLKAKALRLKRDYGITLEDFERMREEQKSLCAICGNRRHDHLGRGLSVDHCHITGKVRGLLCPRCNGNLGYFEKYREQMLSYLDKQR